MAELEVVVYGYVALRRNLDPCTNNLEGMCPMNTGPIDIQSNIDIPKDVVAKFPGIAYSVPDLDMLVRIYINDTSTGKTVACVEAELSNGKTVDHAAISWVTAVHRRSSTSSISRYVGTRPFEYCSACGSKRAFLVWLLPSASFDRYVGRITSSSSGVVDPEFPMDHGNYSCRLLARYLYLVSAIYRWHTFDIALQSQYSIRISTKAISRCGSQALLAGLQSRHKRDGTREASGVAPRVHRSPPKS